MIRSIVLGVSFLGAFAAPLAAEPVKLERLLDRPLTSVSGKAAQVVCEEANARQDLCAVAGRSAPSMAACRSTVEECRAQDPGPQIDCSLARFDFGPECGATVEQYLACIGGWNAALACDDWSNGMPRVQAACVPLLESCPHFIDEYGYPELYYPPCPEDSPERVDTSDDVYGLDACRPAPARMVTLGDSIAFCTFWGYDNDRSYACAPELIAEHLREHYAPDLTYETYAMPGAITADGIEQAMQVAPGPGHVLVWVYIGGNDIGPCGGEVEDEYALACLEEKIVQLRAEWEPIFAYFSDSSLFPDGATFLLNTQYLPADECEAPGGFESGITPARSAKVREYNQRVFIDRALERADTVAIDQYPDWLGHGRYADNGNCPHCYAEDNRSWLQDGTHPNATGMRHMAEKWRLALDATYAACAAP